MRHRFIKGIRSMVVKVGTSVLSHGGRFDRRGVDNLAKQLTVFLDKGIRVSVVSSGAIGAGMTILRMKRRPTRMEELQGAAAVGQRYLMQCYEEAFSRRGYSTAQVLLTWADLADRDRFTNAKHTLDQIQKWGLVPIINENDTVATEEIRFGDNDRLSSLISILLETDAQVILSDTNGLYKQGLHRSEAHRIPVVERMGKSVFAHVRDKRKRFTVGGMAAKLRSISASTGSGIPVFLADGGEKDILLKIFAGEDVGTLFAPDLKRRSDRRWLRDFMEQIKRRS